MKSGAALPVPFRRREFAIPIAWVIGVALVGYGATGPKDPSAHLNGVNWPGDFRNALLQITIEAAVLYLVIRPRTYDASWGRAAIAFVLFTAWAVLGGIGGIHAGLIDDFHWAWLVLLSFALLFTVAVSVWASIRHRDAAT